MSDAKNASATALSADRDLAHRVSELLTAFLHPLRAAHSFGKGIGLAAPQIGVTRRAAVVQPPTVLFNPRILHASEEADEQYEGCLSFFDVCGTVNRPLRIDVEHTTLDGDTRITTLEHASNSTLGPRDRPPRRHALHRRMPAGVDPVPVEHYDGTGSSWRYESPPRP